MVRLNWTGVFILDAVQKLMGKKVDVVAEDCNSRRRFISRIGGALTLAVAQPVIALSDVAAQKQHRSLVLHHLHTGETVESIYWNGDDYDSVALESINHVLRDFRTGDVHPIERGLLDILHTVQTELGVDAPFHVIGGYRSPKTNDMLRKRSSGVAKKSLHMQGKAIDVRIPDVNSKRLREVAADLHLGGVGLLSIVGFRTFRYWSPARLVSVRNRSAERSF